MEYVLIVIRLALFGIFATAGIGKLLDLSGSKKAVEGFGVPEAVSKPIAIMLPLAELAIAILLLPVETSWFGAIGGTALLLLFVGAMLWQMKKGNAPDCHCFGQIHSEPVSIKSILRNVAFVLLALSLIVSGETNQGINIFDSGTNFSETNIMQVIIGIATLGLLAMIAFILNKISNQQSQIMRRVEVIELLSHESGKDVEHDDLDDPHTGILIGAQVPEFELPNLAGDSVSFHGILKKAKPVLAVFIGPGCKPCESLLPKMETWQEEMGERIEFVLISTGTKKANRAKFGDSAFETILIQEENEIAELLGSRWTPTAVLINANGTVGSRPAAGDESIVELVETVRLKHEELGEADERAEPIFIANGNGSTAKLGKEAPEFSLNDLNGTEVTQAYLNQKNTLVMAWRMSCPHCVNMIEELSQWEKTRTDNDPNLLLISTGEAEEHESLELTSPVLLDEKHELIGEFGMGGTPTAVLIGKDGKFISESAVGAPNVWSLLGYKPTPKEPQPKKPQPKELQPKELQPKDEPKETD